MSEQDTQVAGATNPAEELELETTEQDVHTVEDVATLRELAQKEAEKARQILARAKKAESELKALKDAKAAGSTQQITNTPTDEAIQTQILMAQGLSEELLSELKAIAAVRNVSLIKAQSDPIFVAIKESKEAEAKSAKASLGASRGSRQEKKEKTFTTEGLSPEEHKAMWRANR